MIRAGFGHTSSDGPHPYLRDQLDADPSAGIGVLQIVDQLLEILNGIDVVVRRWANQSHPGRGVADLGNDLVHFIAGQLTSFTGLCPLGDFDLELIGVGQVPHGHTEATGSHLLNGRAL